MTSYGTVLTVGYTGDGLRAWKQTPAGRTYFLYDGTLPVMEVGAGGRPNTIWPVNTYGAAGLVSRVTGAAPQVGGAQSEFYAFDPQGSVVARVDAGGHTTATEHYRAHGAAVSGGASVWGYGAQWGYQTDAESGLQLLTHRYYDPQAGRFLTRDPISYAGGINLYGYVGNNPSTYIDPLGLAKFHGNLDNICNGDCEDIKRDMARLQDSIGDRGQELSRRKQSGLPIDSGHTGRLAAERKALGKCMRRYIQMGCAGCESPPIPVPAVDPSKETQEERKLQDDADYHRRVGLGAAGVGALALAAVTGGGSVVLVLVFVW